MSLTVLPLWCNHLQCQTTHHRIYAMQSATVQQRTTPPRRTYAPAVTTRTFLKGEHSIQYFTLGTLVPLLTFQCATIALAGETTDVSKANTVQQAVDAQSQPAATEPAAALTPAAASDASPPPAPQTANEQPTAQTADTETPTSTDEKKDEKKE